MLNLTPETRRIATTIAAAFVSGLLSTLLTTGGDIFTADWRSLINAGIASGATVVIAWLAPFYKGYGIGHKKDCPTPDNASE